MCLPLAVYAKQKVDLLVFAKRIYIVNNTFSQTTGIAIKNGKIADTGNYSHLTQKYDCYNIINEKTGFIYPGFMDAHCHFSGYALDGYKCDLIGTTSFEDVLNRLQAYEQTNKYAWIYARGWDQNDWTVKEFPNKKELDSLFPNKPVILKRIDGHAILCNQKALDMAGITVNTKIDGGLVEVKNGKLTGILVDNAMEPVEAIIPKIPEQDAVKYLQKTEAECFKYGLTGIIDCGVTADVIKLEKKLYSKNQLRIGNIILLASFDNPTLKEMAHYGPDKKGQIQVKGIKMYADGALGSRGACLLKDYSDYAGNRGMILTGEKEMHNIADTAIKYNLQLCTHAIGDSANRMVLNLYAEYLKGKNDHRWRIEHAQVVDNQDYDKFSTYSVVLSVQPTHAISDMPWVSDRLGPIRVKEAYAYKKLLDENGWIALGTDFPVEAIDPLATFYTAVARKDKNGNPLDGFQKENALSREEALKGMTIWAAKSAFLEKEKGSLEIGKDADLVILDQDIMTEPENKLSKATVICTIIKGNIVYHK